MSNYSSNPKAYPPGYHVLTGNQSAAIGAFLSGVQVVAAYPITPQSPVVEELAKFVEDGEEAEKSIENEMFDLIILDVVMPKKNGFQVCRTIKKNEKTKHIPVILVTSKREDADKFWGKQQGADEYVTKPFEPIDLLAAIKRCLKR